MMTKEERRVYGKVWWAKNRDRVLAKAKANNEQRRERDRNRSGEAKAKQKAYFKAYYAEHREEIIARVLAREKADPERRRLESLKWQHANKEKREQSTRSYREANPDKVKATRKAWYNAHYKRWAAYAGVRRSRLIQRTPAWADFNEIAKVYEACPEGCHVDHIIPLVGKTVSGLHVHYNLQYLPATENLRKSNKMPTNITKAAA